MWSSPDEAPRRYGDPVGEKATYREYLANYRLTIELKCEGLDPEQLARRSVPPSSMSLLGLVRHLAQVENQWFQRVLQGRTDTPRIFKRDDDRDWDFTGAVPEPAVVEEAFDPWQARGAGARGWWGPPEGAALGRRVPPPDGRVGVRDVIAPLMEESARHAGHADLLRECIDGRT